MRIIIGIILTLISCKSFAEIPAMVNYKGDRFNEITCTQGKTCSKSFTGETGQNVTVVVNCATCKKKDAKKPPQKIPPVKKPEKSCPEPKVVEKVVTKVVEKEVEKVVTINREVAYPKKNILSLMVAYGEGGVINYLQKGDTPHDGDYIMEREHGVMIGPMYQRRFGSIVAGGMVLSSGHVGLTAGFEW